MRILSPVAASIFYAGDYSVPELSKVSAGFGGMQLELSRKPQSCMLKLHGNYFGSEYSPQLVSHIIFEDTKYMDSLPVFQPRRNRNAFEDYTRIFLCHSQVYIFARKHDWLNLQRLSLYKLFRTLLSFTLFDERIFPTFILLIQEATWKS